MPSENCLNEKESCRLQGHLGHWEAASSAIWTQRWGFSCISRADCGSRGKSRETSEDPYARHRRSRNALPITTKSDKPIAAAHRIGLIKPSAASGTPMAL